MLELGKVEIHKQEDGTFVADRPSLPGSPRIGRGKTWLEALGDMALGHCEQVRVFDEEGKPMPDSFFKGRPRRD